MADDKNPIEHAVELAVFAPIGFALEARKQLPTYVERGRQQVNMAKVIGQFAVSHGRNTANQKLGKVQVQADALLTEFGLKNATKAPVNGTDATAIATEAPVASAPAPTVRSSAAAAELPIADYDSLAASQVIPRLAGLSPEELEAVHAYELNHRGRKTILGKIAQLGEE